MSLIKDEEDNNYFVTLLRCENCGAIYYTMDAFAFHTDICPLKINNQELGGELNKWILVHIIR